LPAFSATGYREAFDVLDGRLTLDEAIEHNTARNRQLARRQRSWLRSEPGIDWLDASSVSLTDDALTLACGVLAAPPSASAEPYTRGEG
jgi:tRNA dimethylallyltransferase